MHSVVKSAALLPLLVSGLTLAELTPYQAHYSATMAGVPVSGNASRTFTLRSDGQYLLESKADLVLVNMKTTSQGKLQQPLRPLSYSYKQGGFGKKRSRKAQFDWQQNSVTSRKDDKQWQLPLKRATFDELSYQAQLRYDLSQGKTRLNYTVVDDDELDQFRFSILGKETLNTPLGDLKTVRVKRERDNNKRVTEIWFATDYDYVPVQLRQLEKGKEYRLELKSLTLNGQKLPRN